MKFHQIDMLIGMDLVSKVSRWNIKRSPFVSLSKDETLSRLMSAWTTLGRHQIVDALGLSGEEGGTLPTDNSTQFFVDARLPTSNSKSDLDIASDLDSGSDSDSSGGADTANLSEEEETVVPDKSRTNGIGQEQRQFDQHSEHKKRNVRQSSTKSVGSKRRGNPPPRASVDAAPVDIISQKKNPGQQPQTHSDPATLRTHSQHQTDATHQSYPFLPQMNPYMGPLQSNGYIPNMGYMNVPADPSVTYWPPQAPASAPPVPPLQRFQENTPFPEAVGNKTKKDDRPDSPSMLGSPVTVRNVAKPGEESGKDKTREDSLDHVQNWVVGPSRPAALGSRNENIEDMRKRIRKEVETEYLDKQRTNDSKEHLETLGSEKMSTDWKSREEQKQRIVEEVKQGIRTELKATQEFMTKGFAALNVRMDGLVNSVQDDQNAHESRQARMASPTEGDKADDGDFKQTSNPRGDYDVFDHLIIEYASTDPSTVDESEAEIHASSHKSESEIGDTPSTSEVERSRPWKGAAHLGNFSKMVPFYLRGSDAGQTWFRGSEPIYVVELQEGWGDDKRHQRLEDGAQSIPAYQQVLGRCRSSREIRLQIP